MTLKQEIQKVFPELPKQSINNYCSDLLLLYSEELWNWLQDNYSTPSIIKRYRSDVEDQPWYGKQMIEVPFGYPEYHYPKKADIVMVRLGFSDIVVTKEDSESGDYSKSDSFLVGYEDEEGRECEEDGTYL